jgi:glycosyltransferase involved in cell wall biosynthesis
MVIAVSTRFLEKDKCGEHGNFINEVFLRIAKHHQQHTFIFIFDKPYDPSFIFYENIIPVVTGPQAKNPAQWYIWYNIKIPAIIKKYKADIFVSNDGLCSLKIKVPQCMLMYDLAFLNSIMIKKSHSLFYKKFTPKFIKKANVIVTPSDFIKADIIKNYKINDDKIQVVHGGVNENFIPVSNEERETVKQQYADGHEYFIYTGEIDAGKNLLNLLKAFSAFKKRQKSNMQLIIAGNPGRKYNEFTENIRLFRFKEEVKILENLPGEEIVKVTASAYAMVYPSISESFGTKVLQAMKCAVPVITSPDTVMAEICADAALYADPENFKAIAVQMMLIFKNETLRNTLIEKGKSQVKRYSWDTAAELFWKAIEKTMLA